MVATAIRTTADFDAQLGAGMREKYVATLDNVGADQLRARLDRGLASLAPRDVIKRVAQVGDVNLPERVASLHELEQLAGPIFPAARILENRLTRQVVDAELDQLARLGRSPDLDSFGEQERLRQQARQQVYPIMLAFREGRPAGYRQPPGFSREQLLTLIPELADLGKGLTIRSWADAEAILTPAQFKSWTGYLRAYNLYSSVDRKLSAGEGEVRQFDVLQSLGALTEVGANVLMPLDPAIQAKIAEIEAPKSLADANLTAAAEMLTPQNLPSQVTLPDGRVIEPVVELARALDVIETLSEEQLRGAISVKLAQLATGYGVYFGDVMRDPAQAELLVQSLKNGAAGAAALAGSAGNFFKDFARGFKKLIRDPLGWARRVFVTEPGKAIRNVGREILRGRNNVPFLGKFFLDPFGFTAQAVFLEQLGEAMVDGSISTFDEAKFGFSVGRTFSAAGEALLAASPFLPPPWSLIAAAAGALSKAAGELIQNEIGRAKRATDAEHERERAAKAQAVRNDQLRAFVPAFVQYAGNALRAVVPDLGIPQGVQLNLTAWSKGAPPLLTAIGYWPQFREWRAFAIEGQNGIPFAGQEAKAAA